MSQLFQEPWASPRSALEAVEMLRNCVTSRSTGGPGEYYRELRQFIHEAFPQVWDRLPSAIHSSRNDSELWAFIKPLFATYDDRRSYWRDQFRPAFDYLEGVDPVHQARHLSHTAPNPASLDSKRDSRVALVLGRDKAANKCAKELLTALGLEPVDFEFAKADRKKGHDYIHEVVSHMFALCSSAVVVLSPDEEASLIPCLHVDRTDGLPRRQPRPNVLFEYGIAIGKYEDRVVVVQFGHLDLHSDVTGLHPFRWSTWAATRDELLTRFRNMELPLDENHSVVPVEYQPSAPDPAARVFMDKWQALDGESRNVLRALVLEGGEGIPEPNVRRMYGSLFGLGTNEASAGILRARTRLDSIGLIDVGINTNMQMQWSVRKAFERYVARAVESLEPVVTGTRV